MKKLLISFILLKTISLSSMEQHEIFKDFDDSEDKVWIQKNEQRHPAKRSKIEKQQINYFDNLPNELICSYIFEQLTLPKNSDDYEQALKTILAFKNSCKRLTKLFAKINKKLNT